MKKTLACLLGLFALLPLAATASGNPALAEVETMLETDLLTVEGGLTEKQFGCGLAVAGLVIGTATLGPGYLVAFGWSIGFHGALFACF